MEQDLSLRTALESSLGVPFTCAHGIQRLRNGDEIFPAMLDAIGRARDRVDLETFIYWSGDIADRMSRALAEAAERGVQVRVLMDGVGSLPMPRGVRRRLAESKAQVRYFRPPHRLRFWKVDERTHRKILVCDDEVAFTGGVGIAEQWEGDARSPSEWRDSHFALRGPVVRQMRGAFLSNWLLAGEGGDPVGEELAIPEDSLDDDADAIPVQVVESHGGREWTAVRTVHHLVFRLARERIRLTTPYFVPSQELTGEIVEAARRGVDIECLVPGPHIDHRVSLLAGQATWSDLLNAGVTIRQYTRTFPHAKVATVDGELAVIGSLNLNRRSAGKDDEIVVNVLDRDFVALLDRDFDDDARTSHEVDRSTEWPRRSLWQRASERIARLVAPQV